MGQLRPVCGSRAYDSTFEATRYQREDGGIGLVQYGASDLDATVLAAIVGPDRFGRESLRAYLRAVVQATGETRE